MEVIKHGNTYKEIECTKCKALLSYCEADIKGEGYGDSYFIESKRNTYEKYVTCPECRKKIMLSFIIDGEETVKNE